MLRGFDTIMKKREANKRAFRDFERAYQKYAAPRYIIGMLNGKSTQLHTNDSMIVRVCDTEDELILGWKDRIIAPHWRVEIVQDRSALTNGMKGLMIEAPNYEIGYGNSMGPFFTVTPHFHEIRNRGLPPARNRHNAAPAR